MPLELEEAVGVGHHRHLLQSQTPLPPPPRVALWSPLQPSPWWLASLTSTVAARRAAAAEPRLPVDPLLLLFLQ